MCGLLFGELCPKNLSLVLDLYKYMSAYSSIIEWNCGKIGMTVRKNFDLRIVENLTSACHQTVI